MTMLHLLGFGSWPIVRLFALREREQIGKNKRYSISLRSFLILNSETKVCRGYGEEMKGTTKSVTINSHKFA